MDKKKLFIIMAACLCMIFFADKVLLFQEKADGELQVQPFAQVKESFSSDIQELKDGKYTNLTARDFTASIEEAEGVYNLEILSIQSYKEKSLMENYLMIAKEDAVSIKDVYKLETLSEKTYEDRNFMEDFVIMNEVIDKFFQEEIDKSFISAILSISNETVYVDYNDIEKTCADEKYNTSDHAVLFGNTTSEGGYMVQITEPLSSVWLSRGELGSITPSENDDKVVYPYVSCLRQVDDMVLHLEDGDVLLSEMEQKVLQYLNADEFPLPKSEGITYGIGEVRVLQNGDYEGVCFKVRRIYEGIPFEYGSLCGQDEYHDYLDHDSGEISYARSEYPDTMQGFGKVGGTVVEMESIDSMLSLEGALHILSEHIGEKYVYEVHGVELVYRNCQIPGRYLRRMDDILTPKWKIMTVRQNQSKYTIFYVDVVTGEVTQRYEYYYR